MPPPFGCGGGCVSPLPSTKHLENVYREFGVSNHVSAVPAAHELGVV